jgi:hypothetical protein
MGTDSLLRRSETARFCRWASGSASSTIFAESGSARREYASEVSTALRRLARPTFWRREALQRAQGAPSVLAVLDVGLGEKQADFRIGRIAPDHLVDQARGVRVRPGLAIQQRFLIETGEQQPLHVFRLAGANADAAGVPVNDLAAVLGGLVDGGQPTGPPHGDHQGQPLRHGVEDVARGERVGIGRVVDDLDIGCGGRAPLCRAADEEGEELHPHQHREQDRRPLAPFLVLLDGGTHPRHVLDRLVRLLAGFHRHPGGSRPDHEENEREQPQHPQAGDVSEPVDRHPDEEGCDDEVHDLRVERADLGHREGVRGPLCVGNVAPRGAGRVAGKERTGKVLPQPIHQGPRSSR